MNAFLRFNKGVLRLPLRVQLYMAVLMALNALAPLYYWSHTEASVVLAAFMASFLLMVVLTARVGFVRLLGMGHIFWVPMIVYLIGRMGEHTLESSVDLDPAADLRGLDCSGTGPHRYQALCPRGPRGDGARPGVGVQKRPSQTESD